jgi:3-phosphoshikimate 1-carboxyvinyltransferase
MSALVLGLGAREPVEIDESSMIATSYPSFFDQMRALGADVGVIEEARG